MDMVNNYAIHRVPHNQFAIAVVMCEYIRIQIGPAQLFVWTQDETRRHGPDQSTTKRANARSAP